MLLEADGVERSLHFRSSRSGEVGDTTYVAVKFVPDPYRKDIFILYSDLGDLVVRVIGVTKLFVFFATLLTHYINQNIYFLSIASLIFNRKLNLQI